MVGIFKWVYAAGAVAFTTARAAVANDPSESTFVYGGCAVLNSGPEWLSRSAVRSRFYNESRFSASPTVGVLAILRETIMLFACRCGDSDCGCVRLIYGREKKEKGAGQATLN